MLAGGGVGNDFRQPRTGQKLTSTTRRQFSLGVIVSHRNHILHTILYGSRYQSSSPGRSLEASCDAVCYTNVVSSTSSEYSCSSSFLGVRLLNNVDTPRTYETECVTTALLFPYDRIRNRYVNTNVTKICTRSPSAGAASTRENNPRTLKTIKAQNNPTSRHRCAYWMLNFW